ncbi:MAG: ATP-binding protein, partial [Cyanobacteria bacterium J06631_9]
SQDISQSIRVHKNYSVLPNVICNPGEINQVLLSILVNAIDVLTQDTSSAENAPAKEIFIRTWVTEGQNIHIGIKNMGPSIPADIRPKIFDPFFTTKPIGQGTGLGLAISYQTMRKHYGNIRVNPEESNGAEFIIDLPIDGSRLMKNN